MPREIVTKAYDGPTGPTYTSRSLAECDRLWNEGAVKPGTFDQLLSEQLRLAVEQGRNEVVVFDLGSGTGALIKNVVNDSGLGDDSKTRQSRVLLEEHPDMRVRLVGLTDAQKPEDFLKSDPITASSSYTIPHPTNRQITAENIHYSITPGQPLSDFLDQTGMPQVDLVFSTSFFIHLDEGVFEQTLRDSAKALRKGGKMIVKAYHTKSRAYRKDYERRMNALDPEDVNGVKDLLIDTIVDIISGNITEGEDSRLDEKQAFFERLADTTDTQLDVAYDRKVVFIQKAIEN